jgi:hypothetical protein
MPSLVGQYDATSPGEIASINFYDAKQYYLRRSTCSADDPSCVVHGSYRVDAATRELVLRDDGASADERLRLTVLETEPLAPAAPPGAGTASLHVDFLWFGSSDPPPQDPNLVNDGPERLVTPLGCLIIKRIQIGEQYLGWGSLDDAFDGALRQQVNAARIPLSDPPSWVQGAVDQTKTSCDDPGAVSAGSLTWQGVDLVDIPSCSGGNARKLNHAIFTRTNLRVAQINWRDVYSYPAVGGPVKTGSNQDIQELMSPVALLKVASGACGLPIQS